MAKNDKIFTDYPRLRNNIFVAVDMALQEQKEQRNILPKAISMLDDLRIKSSNPRCENIVLIIGESHIKSHSSLYGYKHCTNPKLESIRDSIFIFNDVITPRNLTYMFFFEMLSMHSTNDGKAWYDCPLWNALFKASGWNVILNSNQFFSKDVSEIKSMSIERIVNEPCIKEKCFSYHNKEHRDLDGDYLDATFNEVDSVESLAKHNMTIYHFMGQHNDAANRYPNNEEMFKAADYLYRKELNDKQREEVAHYDNACLYNDKQIARIIEHYKSKDAILIYLSDHGDNIYDMALLAGREYNLKKYGAPMYHTQLDIPFLIYPTPKYRENHPEIIQQIANAVNKPFMTDDISHLMLYLAGIDTEWFIPERCLIHPKYNTSKHRILLIGEDYDAIVGNVK